LKSVAGWCGLNSQVEFFRNLSRLEKLICYDGSERDCATMMSALESACSTVKELSFHHCERVGTLAQFFSRGVFNELRKLDFKSDDDEFLRVVLKNCGLTHLRITGTHNTMEIIADSGVQLEKLVLFSPGSLEDGTRPLKVKSLQTQTCGWITPAAMARLHMHHLGLLYSN